MPSTYSNLNYHLIFATKERVSCIDAKWSGELHEYIVGIIRGEGGVARAVGGIEDHVHIVLQLKPTHSIPDLVKRIKTSSTKWINERDKTRGRFAWQVGYGVFSVSLSQLRIVVAYVRNQRTHHTKRDFQEEFEQFLKKHAVVYDEKYLWD